MAALACADRLSESLRQADTATSAALRPHHGLPRSRQSVRRDASRCRSPVGFVVSRLGVWRDLITPHQLTEGVEPLLDCLLAKSTLPIAVSPCSMVTERTLASSRSSRSSRSAL